MKKKLVSLALALVMCLGLTVPAMAAEVKSDKCTYELSNDPIATVEYGFAEIKWDENGENSTEVTVQHTVYVVPDNTTVKSKTVPNGRMPYLIYSVRYNEYGGGNWINEGQPFVVKPFEEEPEYDEEYKETGNKINVPYIYIVQSENMDWGESDKPEMPFHLDEGIYVVAATAAAEIGMISQAPSTPATPTTPETPTAPTAPKFTDVAATSPFAAAIDWAVAQGITKGKTDTTFGPSDTCTVSHILTFLWRANGKPGAQDGEAERTSVTNWAVSQGMIAAGENLDAPCTRSMAVKYIWIANGSQMPTAMSSFEDVSADANYATAVSWAVEKGVTKGTSATAFSPENTCTRGQIVTFLYRIAG